MPACAAGAEPIPGTTAGTVILSLTQEALGDVASYLGGIWAELAVQPVIWRMSLQNLCNLNPDDPGAPTPSDLYAIGTHMVPFSPPDQTNSGLPLWVQKQVIYHYFSVSCQCIGGGTIPPRRPVPPNTLEPPYPTDPGSQTQITRIEHQASSSNDGLLTIYNGLAYTKAMVGDIATRVSPQIYQFYGPGAWNMVGEGQHTLVPVSLSSGESVQDVLGIEVRLVNIPPTVKRRGTLLPRLYGVGSVYWDAEIQSSVVPMVAGRESIHYERQFMWAPQGVQLQKVHWYLQPGVTATGYQVFRNPDGAVWSPVRPYNNAFEALDGLAMPPNWTDKPFYPLAATTERRVWSGYRH